MTKDRTNADILQSFNSHNDDNVRHYLRHMLSKSLRTDFFRWKSYKTQPTLFVRPMLSFHLHAIATG